MNLSKNQQIFAEHVMKLLTFIHAIGFRVTFGEAYRTPEQQEIYLRTGKSKTNNSRHLKKCAIDLNFFDKENNLTYDKKTLEEIGVYWESLDPLNTWGGHFKNFVDTPHFERSI